MKAKWMMVIAGVFLLAACGDNSTETSYNEKTTDVSPTTNATPTVNPEFNPPDNLRTAFQTKYPNATEVTWSPYKPYERINWEWTGWPSMDTTYYAVNYKMDNRNVWSWWDRNTSWIGSSSVLEDSTMLPDAVKKTISKNYTGYRIVSIDEENDKNRTAYEIKLEKGDAKARILVDKNGTILKKDAKA